MTLRVAAALAALMLLPGAVQAQGTTAPLPLTRAIVLKMVPLLQAEKVGKDTLAASLARAGMTRALYGAYKNTLYIAKLDKADAGRYSRHNIAVPVRKLNLELLKAIKDSEPTLNWDGQSGMDTVTPCGVLCGLTR